MNIGVPKEIKAEEYRVGLTPAGVSELCAHGHKVLLESQAGLGVGFANENYAAAGANIVQSAEELYASSELIVKVKEPQQAEYGLLRDKQLLFTFLHLAASKALADALMASGATCIAYETITNERGALPLLSPMSEIAGRLSVQAAAHCLEKPQGGAGVLLGGVPGVLPATVLVIGGGIVGLNAARMAMGLGAKVIIVEKSLSRLRVIDELFEGRISTLYSTQQNLEVVLPQCDAVIGAVLVPGATAPRLVTRDMLGIMKPGSVLVDVAIDQGGCFESSRATSHKAPTYIEEKVVHYCVANIPGAVPVTSTLALTNATLPWVLALADKGEAALLDEAFRNGVNVARSCITHPAVADSLELKYHPADVLLTT